LKRILSLDLASKTGWAFQSADGSIATGVTPFLGTLNPGSRWIRFEAWLGAWWESKPELIIFEEPFIHMKHRSGLGVSYGFKTLLELFAAKNEIRCVGVAPSVLKKWATGRGNADKALMLRFARSEGWTIEDDNEVDARWLLEYARKRVLKFTVAA
jgi:hypothetical protein